MLGFEADELAQHTELRLLPCCAAAVALFDEVQTQWRVGMAGPYALDYTAVIGVMKDVLCIPEHERRALLADLRHMEIAAANTMRSQC